MILCRLNRRRCLLWLLCWLLFLFILRLFLIKYVSEYWVKRLLRNLIESGIWLLLSCLHKNSPAKSAWRWCWLCY